jgi:putative transposase
VDEKSRIKALERAQPMLPMRLGLPEGQTRDYYRHGTTVLFAALNAAGGKVTGKCKQSHKAKDYMLFLKLPGRKAAKGKTLHIIADNYSAHKAPEVKRCLEGKARRFVEHFTPAYSSWLNLIERRFGELRNKRIRRESRNNLAELELTTTDYIISWSKGGWKFVWTKRFTDIQKSIETTKSDL